MHPIDAARYGGPSSHWVQIEAPCAMPEGYAFTATHNEQSFSVTVPKGGVQPGQVISVPFGANHATEGTPFLNKSAREHDVGSWKDGLFDCCRFGPCHPSFLHALFCPQILMAQVLTRLKMNWLGDRAPEHEWTRTFWRVLVIVGFYAAWNLLSPAFDDDDDTSFSHNVMYRSVDWTFAIYTLFVLSKLRRQVRLLFDIPIQYRVLGQWEDCCLSFWCGLCVVSQVARQTCEYEEQQAACWSPTGLQSPSILDATSVLTV
ncbi:hypothetical protein MPSEU_000275500 [Mayamaea pseudoterrestris]|nr:hypothetical protein MPSEU_000275500 [Mayamaea pseudoterrestris]